MHRLGPFAVYSNVFLVMLSLGVISPMLKDIQRDLGVSYGAIAWGVGAFAIARLAADLPAGLAAERYPRALVLLVGSLAVCGGSLIAAWSNDLQTFMLARAISGIGSAITSTVGLTVILDAAAPEHRGRASARYHSALGAGAFVGPGFGGLLSTLGDWRLALAGAGVAALALDLPVAVVRKQRLSGSEVRVQAVAGDVAGRHALIVDDMITTGGTIEAAVSALIQAGALPPFLVAATHAVLVGPAEERLGTPEIGHVWVTDTLQPRFARLSARVVEIGPLLTETVRRLHAETALDDLEART